MKLYCFKKFGVNSVDWGGLGVEDLELWTLKWIFLFLFQFFGGGGCLLGFWGEGCVGFLGGQGVATPEGLQDLSSLTRDWTQALSSESQGIPWRGCFSWPFGRNWALWITINYGKFWKRWEYQTTWSASWEIYMQVRKQQLERDMEQQTGSK